MNIETKRGCLFPLAAILSRIHRGPDILGAISGVEKSTKDTGQQVARLVDLSKNECFRDDPYALNEIANALARTSHRVKALPLYARAAATYPIDTKPQRYNQRVIRNNLLINANFVNRQAIQMAREKTGEIVQARTLFRAVDESAGLYLQTHLDEEISKARATAQFGFSNPHLGGIVVARLHIDKKKIFQDPTLN